MSAGPPACIQRGAVGLRSTKMGKKKKTAAPEPKVALALPGDTRLPVLCAQAAAEAAVTGQAGWRDGQPRRPQAGVTASRGRIFPGCIACRATCSPQPPKEEQPRRQARPGCTPGHNNCVRALARSTLRASWPPPAATKSVSVVASRLASIGSKMGLRLIGLKRR